VRLNLQTFLPHGQSSVGLGLAEWMGEWRYFLPDAQDHASEQPIFHYEFTAESLEYMPIPEPDTVGILIGGLLFSARKWKRPKYERCSNNTGDSSAGSSFLSEFLRCSRSVENTLAGLHFGP